MASPKRQMIRASQVRAPDTQDDLLSDQQIAQMALTAPDAQTFLSLVISRLRSNAGAADWTQPPVPQPGTASYIPEYHASLLGVQDGHNLVFRTQFRFVPISLCLFFNGQAWRQGASYDFIVGESGGSGTGFDTVTLIGQRRAPLPTDDVWVNYLRA